MARYASMKYIERGYGKEFNLQFPSEAIAPRSGIYHCVNCGDEVAVSQGNLLPSAGHHTHEGVGPVLWRLIVESVQMERSSAIERSGTTATRK